MTSTRPQPGTARCPDCGREVDAAADLCSCGFPLMFLRQEEQPSASLAPSRRPAQLDDDTDELPVIVAPEPYAPPAPAYEAPYGGVDLVEEIVCASCEEVNPTTRTWCARCGASLRERAVVVEEPLPAPARRPFGARAVAVLVALLLVAAAVVGAVVLLDREPEPEAVAGPLAGVSVTASRTAPDSTTSEVTGAPGEPVSYDARNVLDPDPSTAWRVDGDGIGQTLTFEFSQPRQVTRVGLIPGYAKDDPSDDRDWFDKNRRITSVVWVFDGDVEHQQTIDEPSRTMATMPLDEPVTARTVVLRITGSTEHDREDEDARDYAPISGVLLEGR